jgi:hypothetical protein
MSFLYNHNNNRNKSVTAAVSPYSQLSYSAALHGGPPAAAGGGLSFTVSHFAFGAKPRPQQNHGREDAAPQQDALPANPVTVRSPAQFRASPALLRFAKQVKAPPKKRASGGSVGNPIARMKWHRVGRIVRLTANAIAK